MGASSIATAESGVAADGEAREPVAGPASPAPSGTAGELDSELDSEEALRRAIEAELRGTSVRISHRGRRSQRAAHIDELRIAAAEPTYEPSAAPPWAARAWRALAMAAEAVSAHDAALDLYQRAARTGARDCFTGRGAARMLLLGGDLEGAERTWLETLERGCPEADAWRELGELYLLWDDPGAAVAALEVAAIGEPDTSRAARLLARARSAYAGEPAPAELEPAWPRGEEHDWRAPAELLAARLRAALPPATRARFDALSSPGGWVAPGWTAGALLGLLIGLRLLRGRGDLVVSIEYPNELKGTFCVRLATQKARFKRRDRIDREEVLKGGPSNRSEHNLVGRETQFRRLPARTYYVTVEGLIQDPTTQEILTDHFEEQPVSVARRKTERLVFDFAPRECPLDVKVLWDKKPVKEAAVAARGLPQSLRFARGGATRVALPQGRHRIAVGSGDRVVECEVDVASFQPVAVEIDLAGSNDVIFKGCPPAVEPYLHGDLAGAARELEREGQDREANVLLARMHVEDGRPERAAEHYETAGQWLEAARLYAEIGHPARAAELFSRAGDAQRAAEMFEEAGEALRAGECFEQAGDIDSAIRCYQESGENTRWIDALERRGQPYEAARVALDMEDRARAIRLLQQVPADHPHIVEAAGQLADVLEQEGHADMAAQRLGEIARQWGPEDGTPELRDRLAGLHEKSGQLENALEVLEELRSIEPTWPNLATRIETIRKRITARQSGGRLSGSDLATTGFLGEQRYELLEEIGRGGMGVVYRARDKRLDRVVALKRLPENLRDHPKAIQLFLREAQASARLTHRNITTVYDADQEDGVFFITMELLKGQPLNKIVRQKKRLSPRDTAKLGVQIAQGLGYAHGQRIVHRDIKTANLFFTVDHTVKIMDFGLAKMMEEVRRAATVIGGTPYYMAPEQGAGEAVDHRADLYAFGVTLFELVTGRLPFTDGDVTYHHRHTPAPDPRQFVADVPAALAELIGEMVAKRPDDRIGSAEEVRARLEQVARSG
ncbi:MAG: protein kinase domain-containing protein [Myxococcota bacterium]